MIHRAMFGALLMGTFVAVLDNLADEPVADKRDAAWVIKRVEAWQPTREERAFDEIGWARDLREAVRLGKEHRRPVFLFTYDGASLSGYRC